MFGEMSEQTISGEEYRDVLTLMGVLDDPDGKLSSPLVVIALRGSMPLDVVLKHLEVQGVPGEPFLDMLEQVRSILN